MARARRSYLMVQSARDGQEMTNHHAHPYHKAADWLEWNK